MTLVVGANGNTGKFVVEQLLTRDKKVKIIVREKSQIPKNIKDHKNLTVIRANLLDLTDKELTLHVKGCNAVVSCLGHNINFKGIYGNPKKLVTDATRRLTDAIKSNNAEKPVKFILMNTTGNRNKNLEEKISIGEKLVTGLIRIFLPPHSDNENAANFLRVKFATKNKKVEWVAVRPDTLIDNTEVSEYEVFPSPIRSAIFNAGKSSRINVGNFMADLITKEALWTKWKGQMPVIYNK